MKKCVCFGFSLAEVLIALSIIGVIAAMTIPNLMVSVGKSKQKAQLTKVMSDLSQAIHLYEYNGGAWNQSLSSSSSLANAFSTVLDYTNFDPGNQATTRPTMMYKPNGEFTNLCDSGPSWKNPYITLKSGMDIMIANDVRTDCSYTFADINACAMLLVDINGQGTGPNKLGQDGFYFTFTRRPGTQTYSIVPMGSKNGSATNPVTNPAERCSGAYARGCAAEILGALDSQY